MTLLSRIEKLEQYIPKQDSDPLVSNETLLNLHKVYGVGPYVERQVRLSEMLVIISDAYHEPPEGLKI